MYSKKRVITLVLTAIIFFIGVFILSYNLTSKYIEITTAAEKSRAEQQKDEERQKNGLKDTVRIILKDKDKVVKSLTLKEYKSENNIQGNLDKDILLENLKVLNYSLETENDDLMVFNRNNVSKLIPNKYYLGEKDGYFAIYKVDSEGNPTIENETEDVFRNFKKVSQLNETDRVKISNFVFSFTTKEEAEEKLTEFIS
ncbi:MAG: hypothetical protein ABRQ27_06270 [Clostridiaceae bacterium]